MVSAAVWLSLAATQGEVNAQKQVGEVWSQLSDAQRAQARAEIEKWVNRFMGR